MLLQMLAWCSESIHRILRRNERYGQRMCLVVSVCFVFFQAEDGIRDLVRSRGLGDVYKRQALWGASFPLIRIASPALGPFGLAGIRCILAALVLSLIHI